MLFPSTPWHSDCQLWLIAHVGTANIRAEDQRAHKCLSTSPKAPVWPAGNLNPCVLLRGARTATQINTNRPPPGAGQGGGGYYPQSIPSTPLAAPSSSLSPYITSAQFINHLIQYSRIRCACTKIIYCSPLFLLGKGEQCTICF